MATRAKARATAAGRGDEPRIAYDRDYYGWAVQQADALRSGRLEGLDLDNLAEEIEDLGREQFNKLESALRIILLHMLKWDHQQERRSRSWATSIRTQRSAAKYVLVDNPGLKSRKDEALGRAYERARIEAADEMACREQSLPADCPYTFDEVLTRSFEWPDA